jgi:hypothetical protein
MLPILARHTGETSLAAVWDYIEGRGDRASVDAAITTVRSEGHIDNEDKTRRLAGDFEGLNAEREGDPAADMGTTHMYQPETSDCNTQNSS